MTHEPPVFRLQRAAWRTMQQLRGEPIVYHVHTTLSIPIERAVLSRQTTSRQTITDEMGFESRRWHWLIDPEDLVAVDDSQIEPAPGHWITRGDDKFVFSPDARNVVWRWAGPGKIWRRVFCEQE